jgi:hypothetical protein
MHTFFHGWRRKLGCIALVMACAVFGMWMRSRVLIDFYEISVGDRQHAFGSCHGYLSWRSWDGSVGAGERWQTLPASPNDIEIFLNLEYEHLASSHTRQWVLPHAWLVVAMTLLAAYLILWKPRKRIEKRDEKPVQTSVDSGAVENRKTDMMTLEEVIPLVEHILREAFRQGKTTISTRAIMQGLQVQNGVPLDWPHVHDAIHMMKGRKYLQHAPTPRGGALWHARKVEGPIYEIRAASRINPDWVPTWFDIYLEKLTETHEKAIAKNRN